MGGLPGRGWSRSPLRPHSAKRFRHLVTVGMETSSSRATRWISLPSRQARMIWARSMAREFSRSEISKAIPVSGDPPTKGPYAEMLSSGFKGWRLPIDGMVARPASFSLDDLKRMPMSNQITHQACEEGWSFIAEWHGVRLSDVLNQVGVRAKAKSVEIG